MIGSDLQVVQRQRGLLLGLGLTDMSNVQLKTLNEAHGTEELRDYLGAFSEFAIVAKAQLSFELFLIRWGRALLIIVGVKQSLHEVEAFGELLWAWASFLLAISRRSSRCVSLLGR